ncbi:MAG TPA: DUF1684 domain-containing protein [Rhizomicrobium sp.]|jgi:uncharacterized protein (DUF1684 family)|nr:DUF1684 domain-containing protein [Rhizomicrobium sp.]
MRVAWIVLAGIAVCAESAGAAVTPAEVTWKKELAYANDAWAHRHYAILKIQDAAYLREGDFATLAGSKGKPESYRWTKGATAGVLVATVKGGHPSLTMNGRTYSESEIANGISVDADVDIKGAPTQVDAGVIGARFMVYNQQAQPAKEFKGVDFFDYDPAYRITAQFKDDPKHPPRVFRTSRGTDKQFYHAGDATFTLQGKVVTLPFYADDRKNISSMSAFFVDDLTGKETYGAGRYVDVEGFGAYPPTAVTIDFNDAYNPNCARSPFFTCPVAVDAVALAIRAGERDPHRSH